MGINLAFEVFHLPPEPQRGPSNSHKDTLDSWIFWLHILHMEVRLANAILESGFFSIR